MLEFLDAKLGVKLAGANCGNGPAETKDVMKAMAAARPKGMRLMVQSNAGLPGVDAQTGKTTYAGTPDVLAAFAREMRALGVDYVGACCGSSPAHIAAIAAALRQ